MVCLLSHIKCNLRMINDYFNFPVRNVQIIAENESEKIIGCQNFPYLGKDEIMHEISNNRSGNGK